MSNYNSYSQQTNQPFSGYSNYSNHNGYGPQYPNYDHYYQQNNSQYNSTIDPFTGLPTNQNAYSATNPSGSYTNASGPQDEHRTAYIAQPVTYHTQSEPQNVQPAIYNSSPVAYNNQPGAYNAQVNAYNYQTGVYDSQASAHIQSDASMAQWNYYGHYYPQQYQKPPPLQKQNKQPKTPAPIADTTPMNKFCCNRALKSVQAITQHELLHIKCPQCDFKCLKSYLEEHEEQYHGKIIEKKPSRPDGVVPHNAPKIDTPEKLAAWIAERKKNWPTPENIARKAQEEAEQMARGELPLKRKAKIQQNERPNKRPVESKTQQESLRDQEDKEEDDDVMDPERDAISSKDPSSTGKILLPEDRPKRVCTYFMRGRCNKGDKCSFLHERPTKQKTTPHTSKIKRTPNLLYKLLEKEIMQEKSVILQCFRYIVDNNFFGKENKET
ncbi:hypothetical protein BY458DRAFT_585239 [Sporodiniella umbellata]|nr:hypothetical protein BY458DRAFT_585239 [Sporodiniella umbellata]